MKKFTFWGVLLLLVIVSVGLFYMSRKNSQDRAPERQLPLRIGYIGSYSGLPSFVAMEQRYFQEEGFDVVEQVTFRTSDLAMKALELGEIDLVGVAGMAQVLKTHSNNPESHRILGVLYSTTALVGRSNLDNQNNVTDLNGAVVACFPGSIFEIYTRKALEAAGVNINTITVVPMPPPLQIQALREGRADAIYTIEPTGAEAIHERVGKYLTDEDLFAKHFLEGARFPGGAVAVSKSFTEKRDDVVPRLLAVYRKAQTFLKADNFDKALYIEKYTHIRAELLPRLEYVGADFGSDIDEEALEKLIQRLEEWKVLKEALPLEAIIVRNSKK